MRHKIQESPLGVFRKDTNPCCGFGTHVLTNSWEILPLDTNNQELKYQYENWEGYVHTENQGLITTIYSLIFSILSSEFLGRPLGKPFFVSKCCICILSKSLGVNIQVCMHIHGVYDLCVYRSIWVHVHEYITCQRWTQVSPLVALWHSFRGNASHWT